MKTLNLDLGTMDEKGNGVKEKHSNAIAMERDGIMNVVVRVVIEISDTKLDTLMRGRRLRRDDSKCFLTIR